PILLYGLEALYLKQSDLNKVDFIYNSMYVKLFNIKDKLSIMECQYYSGHMPASYLIDLRIMNFRKSIVGVPNSLSFMIDKLIVTNDINNICNKYDVQDSQVFLKCSKFLQKQYMSNYLESKLAPAV